MSQSFQPPTPSLPPSIQTLLHPTPTLMDDHLPSYLTTSMIHVLRDSTRYAVKRRRKLEDELREAGLIDLPTMGAGGGAGGGGPGPSTTRGRKELESAAITPGAPVVVQEKERWEREQEEIETDQGLKDRLEAIGRVVGGQLVEHLTTHRNPPPTNLEQIKFICKEFFLFVWAKQVDNLRTNHRGTYVLQSNALPPLIPLSTINGPAVDLELSKIYLIYPTALIQGALAKLGLNASVTAESSTFQIKTLKTQPTGSAWSTLGGGAAVGPSGNGGNGAPGVPPKV